MRRTTPPFVMFAVVWAAAAGCTASEGHDHKEGDHDEGQHKEAGHKDGDHKKGEHNEDDHGAAKPAKGAHGDEHGDEHEGERSVVRVAKEAIEKNDIRVEKAGSGRIGGGVDAPAEIGFQPDKVAHVTLLVPGRITSVKASLGDKVKRGDTLAIVESAELSEAQGASGQAQAALDVAKKSFERQKELQTAGIGAKRNYDEAEAQLRRAEADVAAAQQRTRVYGGGSSGSSLVVKAPIDGEIVERHATVGEVVDPEVPLFVVADLSAVAVEGRVYEKDVAGVELGAAARLTLQAYPGRTWEGKLDYVSPHLDDKTRTAAVRMSLDNAERKLKPGLFGTVTVLGKDESGPRALVPASAVQRTKDGDVVFVPSRSEGEFHAVPVAVGAKREGRAEIVSGIAPGDAVVVSGAFVLKSEMMKSELGEGHTH
ncbi:MAG: efflux RND transporter periplasmic adaptor subunit [Deltaproteobacteria bacterium]|nr:efflux RND transporter periplasmic adaptor subunit [Deltaproteobacteria bacterium]